MNFGHLEKKKKTARISQCVLQKTAPSPSICVDSRRIFEEVGEGAKRKCLLSMAYVPGLGVILLIFFDETLDQLHVDVPVSQMRRLRLGPAKLSGRQYI